MPQIFQVLKCFKCPVFQVHQTKKSNKWECKLCGEKQSMKRHYGLGTGKECRLHVQKLNGIRGQLDDINETAMFNESSDEDNQIVNDSKVTDIKLPNNSSKWLDFVDKDVIETIKKPNEPMYLGNSEVVLEVPSKRRKFTKPIKVSNVKPSNSKDNYFSERRKPQSPPIILYDTSVLAKSDIDCDTDKSEFVNAEGATSKKPEKQTVHNFSVQKVNKNSKWTQFADDDEYTEKNDDIFRIPNEDELNNPKIYNCENTNMELPKNIFSLCDERDLDNVLDF